MKLVTGLFVDSKKAGEAMAELNERGYTKDISVIARDETKGEITQHEVKDDNSDGATTGAVTGGVIGGIVGLLAGVATVAAPGIGTLIVAGPLTAVWGLAGGAIGALTGGLVGALIDAGIPEDKAKLFEERIIAGDVLVTVSVDEDRVDDVQKILDKHQVVETETYTYSAA